MRGLGRDRWGHGRGLVSTSVPGGGLAVHSLRVGAQKSAPLKAQERGLCQGEAGLGQAPSAMTEEASQDPERASGMEGPSEATSPRPTAGVVVLCGQGLLRVACCRLACPPTWPLIPDLCPNLHLVGVLTPAGSTMSLYWIPGQDPEPLVENKAWWF